MSVLCLLRHSWRPMKWGTNPELDCRECSRCGRFEVWVLWGFVRRDRAAFERWNIRKDKVDRQSLIEAAERYRRLDWERWSKVPDGFKRQ